MRGRASADPSAFDCALHLALPPDEVFDAFFDPELLAQWWAIRAAVTTPQPLGIYALEWPVSGQSDPLLGRLGGAFYGIVIDIRKGREFFLADAYWLPLDGTAIGPMAVHVTCDPGAAGTHLRVQVSGCDDSPRWRRFYRVIGAQWTEALSGLEARLTPRAGCAGSSRPPA